MSTGQMEMTERYNATFGNVPTSQGYRQAADATAAMSMADEIAGRVIYDLDEAIQILATAYAEHGAYLARRLPTIFG